MSGDALRDHAKSIFVTTRDGLRLHVHEYGEPGATALSVVCLPGLTRTVADFATLGAALAPGGRGRRVIAIDSRGRGQSDYDPDPQNYNVAVELGDVMTVLDTRGIAKAVFVGSSRGGILTMLLGVARADAIAGVVLHDIGPVIEPAGLRRLKGYVGKLPQPGDLAEGAAILRGLFAGQFPNLTAEQWLAAARNTWKLDHGVLLPTYDVRLALTLSDVDSERPLPPLWKEFDSLSHLPMLVIHGVLSDLLSAETVAAMRAHHPGMAVVEVPDQGHVPLLDSAEMIEHIAQFIAACDRRAGLAGIAATGAAAADAQPSKRWG